MEQNASSQPAAKEEAHEALNASQYLHVRPVSGQIKDAARIFARRQDGVLATLDAGHLGLVSPKNSRLHMVVVRRDRETGERFVDEYAPDDTGKYQVEYFQAAIHHPIAIRRGIPFAFDRPVSHLHAIAYGLDPLLCDTFTNSQHGGVVNLIYAIYGGELWIARVQQERSARRRPDSPSGLTWAVPRGNLDPGMELSDAAVREVAQEVGAFSFVDAVLLPGATVTPDSGWYRQYFRRRRSGEPEVAFTGADAFAFRVPAAHLEPDPDHQGNLRFKPDHLGERATEDDDGGLPERISGCSFSRWEEVAASEDMYGFMMVRLFAYLKAKGDVEMRWAA